MGKFPSYAYWTWIDAPVAPISAARAGKRPTTPRNPLKSNDSASLLFGLVWFCFAIFGLVWRRLGLGDTYLALSGGSAPSFSYDDRKGSGAWVASGT